MTLFVWRNEELCAIYEDLFYKIAVISVSGIYRENGIVSGIDPEQQSKEDVLDRRASIFQVQAKNDLATM